MDSRLNSKVNNKSLTIIFKEDHVLLNGLFTETKGGWEYFTKIIETKKGLFLIPGNGISIYLQKKSFDSQLDVQQIINKIEQIH
ncbi:MAG: hypothetical protein ACI94Y_002571 [Maribacter sp.]|jgi:hypothetical protein